MLHALLNLQRFLLHFSGYPFQIHRLLFQAIIYKFLHCHIDDSKARYTDKHTDDTKQSSADTDREQNTDTRQSQLISQNQRSQNISIKLLQGKDEKCKV